ncbi:MAG TPA: pyridoxamine 5'-phosphate oxidase family protein [Acidimicrobiia bacterium]|nr:pyridoxamine 5'-phosphate oxidase family protein [Acidimicrobiia bacterium]
MSVKVQLEEVRDQVEACRSCAFLLTVTEGGQPHAVSVDVTWQDGALVGGAGRRTAANAERSPEVSLLWPQSGREGYALIVDGTAEVRPDGDTAIVTVQPTGAVLHVLPEARGQGPGCVAIMGHGA